ncbi:toxin-antitoxin system YwqK family antitoxin [Fusobacterium sp.]|uniref:toxin-antitoxin system YwqK family antitoxin n=1 Tax=Fusobacterium sp. TaxID=68766 RepID=UPI0025C58875|nr:toxin-antitoxin system YwqK family antitoxin [Fusobacterium sp.]
MKKILFILLIFNLSVLSFSSNETVFETQLIEKQGVIYHKNNHAPFTGRVIIKKDRNYYLNGKANGKWLTFYPNGNLKSIENWKNGKLFGKFVLYQENGNKIFETVYLNGKDNGKYLLFHKNGVLQVQGTFSNGIPKGTWKYYNKSGKLVGKAVYPDK